MNSVVIENEIKPEFFYPGSPNDVNKYLFNESHYEGI